RMVAVAAGAVDHEAFVREVELRLGGFRATAEGQAPQFASYVGGDFREDRDLMDAQIVLGFEGRDYHMRDFYASQVLSMILGGGMSSRLFQEVREKRGLCYSIYAFSSNFQDGGFTGIYVGTSERDAGEVSAVVAGEMEAMTANIGDAELARAKAQLKSGLLMGLERPGTRSEAIAGQIFSLGRVPSVSEIVEKIEAVDGKDVKRHAARVMRAPSMAALGPIGRLESHAKFSGRFDRLDAMHAAE
ncbi:MAG TPA: pitrilysin family protein, partial [Rhizomicrobium sp.]|nr:pitrilysin family protein [Rhizomicrobium sp.]